MMDANNTLIGVQQWLAEHPQETEYEVVRYTDAILIRLPSLKTRVSHTSIMLKDKDGGGRYGQL